MTVEKIKANNLMTDLINIVEVICESVNVIEEAGNWAPAYHIDLYDGDGEEITLSIFREDNYTMVDPKKQHKLIFESPDFRAAIPIWQITPQIAAINLYDTIKAWYCDDIGDAQHAALKFKYKRDQQFIDDMKSSKKSIDTLDKLLTVANAIVEDEKRKEEGMLS